MLHHCHLANCIRFYRFFTFIRIYSDCSSILKCGIFHIRYGPKYFGKSRIFLAWQAKLWFQCSELHFAFLRFLRCRWRLCPPILSKPWLCQTVLQQRSCSTSRLFPEIEPPGSFATTFVALFWSLAVAEMHRMEQLSMMLLSKMVEAAELPAGWRSLTSPWLLLQHLRSAAWCMVTHLLSCWNCFLCYCFLGFLLLKWRFLWLQFPQVSLY